MCTSFCAETFRQVNPFSGSADEAIDDAIQLIQVAALLDDVAVRQVAIHLAVTEAPRELVLGIQPDELLGALANPPEGTKPMSAPGEDWMAHSVAPSKKRLVGAIAGIGST